MALFHVRLKRKESHIPGFNRPVRPVQNRVRINHQIRLTPVRLIDAEGQQVGVVPVEEARSLARKDGLDLVEVDPNSRPIVCKILDWGREKYEQAKKEKAAKKHEKALELKQIKLRPGVSDHDFDTKVNHARRFLEEGKRTKITVMFRRRDLRRPENGRKILARVTEILSDVAKVESMPNKIENRDLTMVLIPAAGIGKVAPSRVKKVAVEKPAARKAAAEKPTAEEPAAEKTAADTGEEEAAAPVSSEPTEPVPST